MSRISTASLNLRTFVQDHRLGLGQSVRVTISAVVTLVLGQWLHVPLVLWSVLTAVVVTQTSVGRSLKATIDYLVGTLAGAVYAGAVAGLVPHDNEAALLAVLALAVAPLAFLAAINSSFNVGPFTAVIVILAPLITHTTPLESAFYRVLEVALGATVGLMVSVAIFPAHAHRLATETVAQLLDRVAKVLPQLFAGFTRSLDPADLQSIQESIGQEIVKLDAIYLEVRRERMTHIASEPDPAPLLRTLLRLRHDLVIIGRAAATPLAESLQLRLEPILARIAETAANYLRGCATALIARGAPPPLEDVTAAFVLYSREMTALRRENLLRALPSDALERFFALGFALEQMHQHFKDLQRCVREVGRSRPPFGREAEAAAASSEAP